MISLNELSKSDSVKTIMMRHFGDVDQFDVSQSFNFSWATELLWKFDCEIVSTVILPLLSSTDSRRAITGESMCTSTG